MGSVTIEKFKLVLDKFLEFIPDEQKCPTTSQRQEATASLISYRIVRLMESTMGEEISDLAEENVEPKPNCFEMTPSIPRKEESIK